LFVTFRTFDAIRNSADPHKKLRKFYPTSTILMPTCNVWRCYLLFVTIHKIYTLCANHKVYLPQLTPRLCHCINILSIIKF